MIRFHCKSCGQKIGVPDEHAGRRVKCPSCGNPQRVPAQTEDGVVDLSALFELAETETSVPDNQIAVDGDPSQNTVAAPDSSKIGNSAITVTCVRCAHRFELPETLRGSMATCHRCGQHNRVPGRSVIDANDSPRRGRGLFTQIVESAWRVCVLLAVVGLIGIGGYILWDAIEQSSLEKGVSTPVEQNDVSAGDSPRSLAAESPQDAPHQPQEPPEADDEEQKAAEARKSQQEQADRLAQTIRANINAQPWSSDTFRCTRLDLEPVSDNVFQGQAMFSDGQKVTVTVELDSDGEWSVQQHEDTPLDLPAEYLLQAAGVEWMKRWEAGARWSDYSTAKFQRRVDDAMFAAEQSASLGMYDPKFLDTVLPPISVISWTPKHWTLHQDKKGGTLVISVNYDLDGEIRHTNLTLVMKLVEGRWLVDAAL